MSDKLLLLRYSDFHGVDTIKEHEDVIQKTGHCWWAKIGKQPGKVYLQDYLLQEKKYVLLYTPKRLHLCKLGDVLRERPQSDYPKYYEKDVFGKENEPSVYFELCSIEAIDLSFLEDYAICCSRKDVLYDLKKTISSYMFIQNKADPFPQKKKRIARKPQKKVIDPDSCVHKKNGVCSNASSYFYLTECLRPRYCIKQRPIKIEVE